MMKVCPVWVVSILAVTSDALRLTSKLNEQAATLERMQWWQAAGEDKPLHDKYVMFTPDAGGLNNIRMGWEFAGIIAQRTGRTLVLPPPSPFYLLDHGPGDGMYNASIMDRRPKNFNHGAKTSVEDLIDLKQLKGNLATLTWKEFEEKTGKNWATAKKESKDMAEGFKSDCKNMIESANDVTAEIMFLDGGKREPFTCGEWFLQGGPRDELRTKFQERDWALLTHGFVWHPDAFDIASKVVNYLGLFQYNALHARYGDLQFTESKEEPSKIFAHWPSLQNGAKLYVATDAPDKFKTADVLNFDDFFLDKTERLLAPEKELYSSERWFKLTGLVEELICTYSKLFVGSEKSSFSGHIQRQRIHAGTPNAKPLYHTNTESSNADATSKSKVFQRKPKTQGDIFMQLS